MLDDFEVRGAEEQRRAVWALALRLFRSEVSFAHVDLIPDGSPSWPLSAEERKAFAVLQEAVARDAGQAVPASSGGPPLGLHVELADPDVFEAIVVYGVASINCEIYRHRDRAALQDAGGPMVWPMVSTHDQRLTPLNLEEDEAELLQDAVCRSGLDVEVVRCSPPVRWARLRSALRRSTGSKASSDSPPA